MSNTLPAYVKHDRRARRRFKLPGRAALGWLAVGLETFILVVCLYAVLGVGALAAGCVWIVLAYPVWYHQVSAPVTRLAMVPAVVFAWCAASVAGLAIGWMTGALLSFPVVLAGLFLGLVAGITVRLVLSGWIGRLLSHGQLQLERVGIVGGQTDLAAFLSRNRLWTSGLQPALTFSASADQTEDLAAFIARCVEQGCTRIIFVSSADLPSPQAISDLCMRYHIDADFAPTAFAPEGVERIAARPVGFTGMVVKRVFDILASGAGLLVLSPLLLLTALIICLESPGPAFFRQERMGFNGRSFMIWKFRSMRVMEAGTAMRQAQKNDGRITRFGAFLRKTSIDELPQLLNVLRGDMSLIGPRPHAVSHDSEMECMVARYAHRNRIKPGISGWAQVNGYRGDTSTLERIEGRVAHDLYYIENWSIQLDLYIIFLTIFSRKTKQNAY